MVSIVCIESDDQPFSIAARLCARQIQAKVYSASTLEAARQAMHITEHSTTSYIVLYDALRLTATNIAALRHDSRAISNNYAASHAKLCALIAVVPQAEYVAVQAALQLGADDVLALPHLQTEMCLVLQRQYERLAYTAQILQQQSVAQAQDLARKISASLPHEFRTPLNSLMGFTHLLQEQVLTSEDIPQVVGHIDSSVKRLYRTAEKFLLYVDVERSAMKDANTDGFITFDFADTVYELAGEIAIAYQREEDIAVTIEPLSAPVQMRNQYVRFLVMELITNACKFSDPHTPLSVSLAEAHGYAVFTVRDAGRGMTPQQVKSIAPFRQFERDYYEQQGVGLGLVIVKNILALAHGTFQITSNEQGTTITAGIPLRADVFDTTANGFQYATMHPLK